MSGWDWALFILIGGTAAMVVPFLIARTLVYRQTEPWRGREYLQWFREEKARERAELVRAELARLAAAQRATPAPRRPKELVR